MDRLPRVCCEFVGVFSMAMGLKVNALEVGRIRSTGARARHRAGEWSPESSDLIPPKWAFVHVV